LKIDKNQSKCAKNCCLVTMSFGFWIPITVILALKRPKKNTFLDPNFGPADN